MNNFEIMHHQMNNVDTDQYPELLEFYCNKLFFTLEIQIIEICTFLICGTGEYFVFRLNEYLKSEDFKTLKTICKHKDLLCSKVKIMLYTLYCSSRFNTRIMHFLNEISTALKSMEV